MLRRFACTAVCLLAGWLGARAQQTAPVAAPCPAPSGDLRDLIRRVADNVQLNDKRAREYTYLERETDQKVDKDGSITSSKTETHEIMILDNEFVERLVARDDRPLPSAEAQKEEERINKWLAKRQNESAQEKQKRLAAEERERNEQREFESEIADAFRFQLLPEETIGSRRAYVVDASPLPDYRARSSQGRILPHFHFRVWIDQSECQFMKFDAQVISTVSVDLALARMYPGTRLVIEQTRVNDEVWLPAKLELWLRARVMLLKSYNENQEYSYSDYKKFRTNIQIVPQAAH
jgi:hypothetical protein